MVKQEHLHTSEAIARRAASRTARIGSTRPTTKPGSETTDLLPGDFVRVRASVKRYGGRSGRVATINTQTFSNGSSSYVEVGVTWNSYSDWAKAGADLWFRADELDNDRP